MPSVFRDASVVHEPSPIGPPYRASSSLPAGPPPAPRSGCISGRARRARSSFSLSTVTASSACAIATMCGGRSGSKPWSSSSRNAIGAATASLRPRPDRRVTDPLRRRRSPRPREGGWWDVEPRAKGVGIALRSRHRARLGGPDRLGRRGQARPEHLTVDTATGGPRHPLSDAGRHPDIDASIHQWMLASDHGSRALQSNYSSASKKQRG